MKALIPTLVIGAAALLVATQSPAGEQAPAGAAEQISQVIPNAPYAKPLQARKLLIFSKTNGYRHAAITTGKILLTEMGRKTGAFETVISDDLDQFEIATLKNYDAVCFMSTTGNVFLPPPAELSKMTDVEKDLAHKREMRLKDNLLTYVKAGRGFIGIHAATDTCAEWPDYGKMINGFFDGHPWSANTMVSVKVEPGQESHPLVAMFGGKNLDFPEEIYQLKDPYDSKAVHMLLRLDTEKTNMKVAGLKRTDGDYGIAWARHWGKGRVFYCSLGHNHEMYWNPKVIRHYLAGIQWAIGDFKVEVKDAK